MGHDRDAPRQVYSSSTYRSFGALTLDLMDGLNSNKIWRAFAWSEIKNRYRGSVFGIAWIGISFLTFVLVIDFFFQGFSSNDSGAFIFYVTFGFAAFSFVLANITDGPVAFIGAKQWIMGTPLPYSIYIFKSVARSVFVSFLQLICAFGLAALFGWRPTTIALLAIPGMLALLINSIWIQYILGYLTARFRDINHLVPVLTRLLFFTTPILWVFDERSDAVRTFARLNPMTHMVEVVRAPLLGEYPSVEAWCVVVALAFGGFVASSILSALLRHRLPYWV